jgi:predicted KAP-like P-loop ATPase
MQKIYLIMSNYKKWIKLVTPFIAGFIMTFLISVPISTILIPFLFSNKLLSDILLFHNIPVLVGFIFLFVFFLLLSWKKANDFWRRYRNTYKIENPYPLIPDYLILVLVEVVLIYSLIADTPPYSREISVFAIISALLFILWLLVGYFWKPKRKEEIRDQSVRNDVSDDPISFSDEDLLNRERFVKSLLDELNSLTVKESFVYSLEADWGEGKTSVLNLLKKLVQTDNDNKFIVIGFDPWNFKNQEAMLKSFFNELENAISSIYILPNLKKVLAKYHKTISYGLFNTGIRVDFKVRGETIEEIRKKIESYIEKTGRKLLIIIDEIDRLQPEEVLMIFKLVRANLKFKNTVFILSYDIGRVTETGKNLGIDSKYLEKIVQKPLSLPKIESTFINNFLLMSQHPIPKNKLEKLKDLDEGSFVSVAGYLKGFPKNLMTVTDENGDNELYVRLKPEDLERLKNKIKAKEKVYIQGRLANSAVEVDQPNSKVSRFKLSRIDLLFESLFNEKKIAEEEITFFDKEFVYFYNNNVVNVIRNFRDAKRFLNSLYSSLPPIADEVNLFDFTVLEFIKVFARPVYDDIYEYWGYYVDERAENEAFANPFFGIFSSEKDKKLQKIKEHIDTLFQTLNYESSKEKAIRNALYALFPNLDEIHSISSDERKTKRIRTSSFIKYFTLSVTSTELPDTFFENAIKSWDSSNSIDSIEETIKSVKKSEKLGEFLDKFRRIYADTLTDATSELFIKAVYKQSHTFQDKNDGDPFSSEYDRGVLLILRVLNSRIAENKIQKFLEEAILKTTDLLLAVDLVLTTKPERGNDIYRINENIDHGQLRKLLSERLEKDLIDKKRNIISDFNINRTWGRLLFQWSSNWGQIPSPNREKVTDYILPIIRTPELFMKFINNFKNSFSNPFGDGKWVYNPNDYENAYNLDKILKLAIKMSKKTLSDEQKNIIDSFISITQKHLESRLQTNDEIEIK